MITMAEAVASSGTKRKNTASSSSNAHKNVAADVSSKLDFASKQKKKVEGMAPVLVGIDMSMFSDVDGNAVERINDTQFSQNQVGICPMDVETASRYLPQKSMSVGALAILTVGRIETCPAERQVVFPATGPDGQPYLIQGNLLQYGDKKIILKDTDVNISMNVPNSTALAIEVDRVYIVGTWDDICKNPFAYIVTHVPSLKDSGSFWAKAFYKDRKPSDAKHATTFFCMGRLTDNLLDSAMCSGSKFGIFISPRTADKRKDHRYRTVPIVVDDFKGAFAAAAMSPSYCGLVKRVAGWAVRCRAEQVNAVRRAINPDLPVSDDEVPIVSRFFKLVGVQSDVPKAELTKALKQAGFTAKAIKPLGTSAWLVGSDTLPPQTAISIQGVRIALAEITKPGSANATLPQEQHAPQQVFCPAPNLASASTATAAASAVTRIEELEQQLITSIATKFEKKFADQDAKMAVTAMQVSELSKATQALATAAQETAMKVDRVEVKLEAANTDILKS